MGRQRIHALALGALAGATLLAAAAAAQRPHTAGYAWNDPHWRFTHHERPVKVVLLAGSIGAYRNRPYGALLHQWCANAEVRNVSEVGAGAPQLLARFQHDVLQNPNVPVGAPNLEMWLLFGGGLNSVAAVTRTNYAMSRLFRLAHRRGFSVVALTLTPWGDDGTDDVRWREGGALHALRHTRQVVDFVMGRVPPADALGPFANRRPHGVSATDPWTEEEQPDVRVDLYDSALRDRDAEPWSVEDARRRIRRDRRWHTLYGELQPEERAARLEADARFLAEAPRWFLRQEYRGFDHIHPNRAGHYAMAQAMCPHLPESWGCRCP